MLHKSKFMLWMGLVALIGFALFFLLRDPLGGLNLEKLTALLQALGPWAALLGGGLIVVQTFFPIMPFLVIAGANVLVFGLWGGFFINWVSAVIASVLMFWVARTTGRSWAERKIQKHPKLQRINEVLEHNSFKSILLLRLFPVIPPVAVNLAAGLSSIPARSYILATGLGKLPTIGVQSIIGNDLFHFSENKLRLMLLGGGFLLVLFMGMRWLRKKMHVHEKEDLGDSKITIIGKKERVK